MISKDMAILLSQIPRTPYAIKFCDLKPINKNLTALRILVNDASSRGLVSLVLHTVDFDNMKISLTEEGQAALEEFNSSKLAAGKSTWALIIAGLSLVVSIAAIFVTIFVK